VTIRYKEHGARPMQTLPQTAFHEWVFPDGAVWTQFFRLGADYLLRFPELADFEVSADGTRVQGFPAPGVPSPTVEHLYLNQALPLALSRQGKLVLHGSAVDIGGLGVAFLGESGRGKSTLAASFATGGDRFLTDDGLLLEWAGSRCMIVPSHPSIRLWEDSQDALVNEHVAMAPAVSFTSKARFLAGPDIAFCDQAQPLRRLYFLGDGQVETPTVEPLRPAEALIELVKHSFLLDIEAQDGLARHFDDLSRLAALPIYFRLDYPRRYDALAAVRETVVRHAYEQQESSENEFV
jgi:hypothetical protein